MTERFGAVGTTIEDALAAIDETHPDKLWLQHVYDHLGETPLSVVMMAGTVATRILNGGPFGGVALAPASPPPAALPVAETQPPALVVEAPAYTVAEPDPLEVDLAPEAVGTDVPVVEEWEPEADLPPFDVPPSGGVFGSVPSEVEAAVFVGDGGEAVPFVIPTDEQAPPPPSHAPLPSHPDMPIVHF